MKKWILSFAFIVSSAPAMASLNQQAEEPTPVVLLNESEQMLAGWAATPDSMIYIDFMTGQLWPYIVYLSMWSDSPDGTGDINLPSPKIPVQLSMKSDSPDGTGDIVLPPSRPPVIPVKLSLSPKQLQLIKAYAEQMQREEQASMPMGMCIRISGLSLSLCTEGDLRAAYEQVASLPCPKDSWRACLEQGLNRPAIH